LGYRIGARLYSRGPQFTASDGGGLGKESSQSVSGTLFAMPADGLTIKLRAFYNEDDDGPPASGLVAGLQNDSCTGKSIETEDPAQPTAMPRRYICGQVPTIGNAVPKR